MDNKLSKEEIDIVNAIEGGEFKSVKNLEKEKQKYSEYAADTLKNDKRDNFNGKSAIMHAQNNQAKSYQQSACSKQSGHKKTLTHQLRQIRVFDTCRQRELNP